jgi:NAD(P)-dependent dehydrogenase (short-subunit alcohol dehydrogenase family)
MDLGIDGNTALVTGATAGLGLASAAELARNGANVAVCGRDRTRLDSAEEILNEDADGDVLGVQADITNQEDVQRFVRETVAAFGGIDHVVTSAGGPPPVSFAEATDEGWYDSYDQLVMSVVWTLRAAQPHLLEDGGGTIVAITSRSVKEVIDGNLLSNAVRRAVIGIVKTVSREFAPEVRANAVLPGPHETNRLTDIIEGGVESGDFEDYESGLDYLASDVPMDRVGRPEELGDAVAWLSSERASYVNGTALPIDGGGLRST